MSGPAGPAPQPDPSSVPKFLTTREIQQKLEENSMLIQAIVEKQNESKLDEAVELQKRLNANLLLLAKLADQQAAPQG